MLGGLHYSYKLEVSFLSGAIRRSSFLLVKLEGVFFFLQTLCRSVKVKNKVGFMSICILRVMGSFFQMKL